MKRLQDIDSKLFTSSKNLTMNDVFERHFDSKFSSGDEVKNVPVIQTTLTFEQFFHPDKFVRINKNLIVGQRDFVQLRWYQNNNYQVFIQDKLLFFDIHVVDNNWDKLITDTALCSEIIHFFRISLSRGEFKFEPLCNKCNNTKVLTQTVIEPAIYNGFKVNIHQQQEISCTCNS